MRYLMLLLAGLCLACCGGKSTRLPPPDELGRLVVAVRASPTSFYINAENNYAGYEYELLSRFAAEMRLKTEFVLVADVPEALQKLARGEVHLVAMGLPLAEGSSGRASHAYQPLMPVLVTSARRWQPKTPRELAGRQILALQGTHYADLGVSLQREQPGLQLAQVVGEDQEVLLERVSLGNADGVICSQREFQLARTVYPDLVASFAVGSRSGLTWQLSSALDNEFVHRLNVFIGRMQREGVLTQLSERYFGHMKQLARPDIEGLLQKRQTELPQYMALFQAAEQRSGIDWRLLAAIGYQESHWDAMAVSPAGARGLMMLTAAAAEHFKVSNRHDAQASFTGGADLLRYLKESLPSNIGEPDRTWIALAAYNAGPAHVQDAALLARRLGRDSTRWLDIREMLLLLREPRYYRTVKYGYVRGLETVRYTEAVRTYFDILVRFEDPFIPLFPATDSRVMVSNPGEHPLSLEGGLRSAGQQTLSRRRPLFLGPPYITASASWSAGG